MKDVLTDYIAGTAGGIAVVLVGHPFDTTKTRMQTAPPGYYEGAIDCVKKTFADEGFKGFYSGMMSPVLGQMVFRATGFTSFHRAIAVLTDDCPSEVSNRQLFVAGAATGFIIAFIEAPIDLVKTRMQIQVFARMFNPNVRPLYNGVIECGSYVGKTYGVRGLWQGLSATVIRNVPANAVFFPMNEIVKSWQAKRSGKAVSDLGYKERLLAGACAGLSYWVSTYPLDVIKGKMHAQPFEERLTWLQTARKIWRDNGWRGFTRGFLPCASRAIPACSVMFTTMDLVRAKLRKDWGLEPIDNEETQA